MQKADLAIIGGGIVGLATAYRALERNPRLTVVVLEKEHHVAAHQTGHNSGVVHSGIYYRPGSLRAETCRAGKRAMEEFCERESIPLQRCGKVIVAVDASELPQLDRLFDRGQANGVDCRKITAEQLREIEPHARGAAAIHVPEAGIVDYRQVAERLAGKITAAGGAIWTHAKVVRVHNLPEGVLVQSTKGDVSAQCVVNCAGLHSDRVTKLSGQSRPAKIVPFRGEYYELKPSSHNLVRGLIYPVPDPNFPFLGVHFTRLIHGGVECGPNAVLAFAREGYFKTSVNLRDLLESLTYIGFRRLAWRHWDAGWRELHRSWSKAAFVHALQRLVPEIRADELLPAPAGVRAQALTKDGELVDDFLIQASARVVNVCNAPSPAATASLKIADYIVDEIGRRNA